MSNLQVDKSNRHKEEKRPLNKGRREPSRNTRKGNVKFGKHQGAKYLQRLREESLKGRQGVERAGATIGLGTQDPSLLTKKVSKEGQVEEAQESQKARREMRPRRPCGVSLLVPGRPFHGGRGGFTTTKEEITTRGRRR